MFFTWDLEAEDWDKVTNACFVSSNDDVEHFEGNSAIADAAEFQDKVGGNHIAHASGIYDTLLVSQARDRPWQDLIMSGSAVLCAHDRNLRVRDSFRWWLQGLKKVGQYLDKLDTERAVSLAAWQVGHNRAPSEALQAWKAIKECNGDPWTRRIALERKCKEMGIDWHALLRASTAPEAPHAGPGAWLKKDVDRTRMAELTPREKREYCESDTRILMEGVKTSHKYLDDHKARRAWTAGASAVNLMKVIEPASWGLLEAHRLDFTVATKCAEAIRGARVETWALGKVENVYCYDRKSAYPAAYAFQSVPVGARELTDDELMHPPPGAVIRCKWFWPFRGGESTITDDRARIPPVLDQLTGAGAGWCEGWLIDEEIRELEDFVGVRRLQGWAGLLMAPVGQLFVRELYAEKERGSFNAKVFVNSWHGKTSEQPVKECWTYGEKPTDYYGPSPEMIGDYWHWLTVAVDDKNRCAPNVQPIMAAYILGRARIALWRDVIAPLLSAGWRVYYVDTDSVHTNCPPDKMPIKLGAGIGDLAFEGGPYTCFYVGPKSYCAVDPTTGKVEKGACKGIPWGSLKDGVRESSNLFGNLYRQARGREKGEDMRLAVFEEALKELTGAKVKKEGIATWKQGLRLKDGWRRYETTRTLIPHERGKLFDRAAGPTVYGYQSPAELLNGRGVDLSKDPFEALVENPAEDDTPKDEVAGFFD